MRTGVRGTVRDYAVVTGSYWAFTLTDGALRMLLLLHLHELGARPIEIAALFLSYEACGIATNFAAGRLGARYGLKSTLVAGLSLQIAVCLALVAQAQTLVLPVLFAAQCVSGIAKDLTKTSAKSYVKLVAPEGDSGHLMRLVALLTGSKNTLKGVGFFGGGALLWGLGFANACWSLIALLVIGLIPALRTLESRAGRSAGARNWRLDDARIQWLSLARLFLFGARDVWFAIALPLYFADQLGWSHLSVGAFLAAWIIGYGVVQALAPRVLRSTQRPSAEATLRGAELASWAGALLAPLAGIYLALDQGSNPFAALGFGLGAFGILFAVCSALHSFLIVEFARPGHVAQSVGFYYMSNAAGRFLGTAASAVLYQSNGGGLAGLQACLIGSSLCVATSAALGFPLRAAELRHLKSGSDSIPA